MSVSPNSLLLQRTIDLNYAQKQRSSSMRWITVNGIIFTLFAFDLWGMCEGYMTALHYVELVAAAVLAANMVQHALRLLPPARAPRPLPVTPHQRRLLGLGNSSLDGSFCEVSPERSVPEAGGGGGGGAVDASAAEEALSLSMSASLAAARAWRSSPSPSPPRSPAAPPARAPSPPRSPHSPHSPPERYDRDEFIADGRALADYLRRRADRSRDESAGLNVSGIGGAGSAWGAPGGAPPPPPTYQLAALDTEGASEDGGGAGAGGAGGGGGAGAGAGGAAQHVWRRLQLDPRRLTEYNLNLRLWLHVTILARLAREMDAQDAALAALGLPDVRIGQASTERLRRLAAAHVPALGALLPFLEPFPDQCYVVQRYRELAAGGCLSAYKWNGGGADWEPSRPTDPELVLHALAAYMDAQLPAARAWFSGAHVSAAPAPAPRAGLGLHRVSRAPPHYVVVRGADALEVGAGRNNLLHALLLFVAAAARADPPALRRLHLGPAGLNMLWIIGR